MRDQGVLLRLSAAELEAVDRVRGTVPRAVWIRELCRDAVAAHDALEGEAPATWAPPADPRAASAEQLIEQAARLKRARPAMREQPRPIVQKRPRGGP